MPSRVITVEDAVAVARRQFVDTGHLDMSELAERLAVSRATLYRVVASRDRLLGDVLWQLGHRTMELAVDGAARARLTGVERMLEISRRFEGDVASFDPLQRFLQSEPLVASRVLFTPAGRVHERFVGAWTRVFEEAEAAGELALPFDVQECAYLYVRIGESMLFGDLLAGVEPDVTVATRIRRAILTAA